MNNNCMNSTLPPVARYKRHYVPSSQCVVCIGDFAGQEVSHGLQLQSLPYCSCKLTESRAHLQSLRIILIVAVS